MKIPESDESGLMNLSVEEHERRSQEARQRLSKEVEELKRKEATGEKAPSDAMQRILESRNARDNIICIADVFKEVAKDWEEKSKKVQRFAAHLWEKVDALSAKECPKHNMPLPVNRDATFSASWKEQKVRVVYGKCLECEVMIEELFVNEKWKKMGIPERLLHETFDTFNAMGDEFKRKVLLKASSYAADQNGFLILRGTKGTGKSHLAVGAIKEKREGLFITEADLIGELRQTYADDTGPNKLIDKYRQAKVFVLDELSKEVRGADIPTLLYRILSYRYDKKLLTVITSNESLEDILEILGEKLTDRIRDNNTVVTCEWASFRGQENNYTECDPVA